MRTDVATGTAPETALHLTPYKQSDIECGILLHNPYPPRIEFACESPSRPEALFRHSCWARRRAKIWGALRRLHVNPHRLDRFCTCGSHLCAQRHPETGDIRITSNHCNDRFCVPCQAAKARRISQAAERLIKDHGARFVTLTMRAGQTPLVDQIDRIYRSFLELRRRHFWKNAVQGGAAFLEVKIGEKSGLWHVHLHILAQTKWLDQRTLSTEWHAVTGDSSIVDVRPIDDAQGRARYVTKYVTKPMDSTVYQSDAKMDECIMAMKGRRLCSTFGSWRGTKLDAAPETGTKWIYVGRIDSIATDSRRGDETAQRLWHAITTKYPRVGEFFSTPPPS